MEKSDLTKYSLGGLVALAIAENLDLVELLKFLAENPIPLPNLAEGHGATATGSSGVAIEVPSGKLTLTGHALTATTSSTATAT
jgi:hypothetical protein